MLLGYARVSTDDQILDLQLDALRLHQCQRFFSDVVSGAKASRPGLDRMLKDARENNLEGYSKIHESLPSPKSIKILLKITK